MKKIKLNVTHDINSGKPQIYAIVDDEDYAELSKYNWTSRQSSRKFTKPVFYVYRRGKNKDKLTYILMHRQITNYPANMVVDHINHNGLDNRKSNLRICTIAENVRNRRPMQNQTSKYKGVSWNKFTNRWRIKMTVNSKLVWLGQGFTNQIEAAKIYDAAAHIVYKKFAYFNFGKPSSEYLLKTQKIIDSVLNRKYISKYRGVTRDIDRPNWRAIIRKNGKKYSLGTFKDEINAAKTYDAAHSLLDSSGKRNFPEICPESLVTVTQLLKEKGVKLS